MSEELKSNAEQVTEDTGMVRCPCCGKMTLPKQLKPSDELLDQWMACMVTATPFSKTYPVYNGRLMVTAIQLTVGQTDTVRELTALLDNIKDMDWKKAGYSGCPTNIDQMTNNVYIYSSIVEIRIKGKSEETVFKPSESVWEAAKLLLSKKLDILTGSPFTEWADLFYKCEKLLIDPVFMSSVPLAIVMGVAEAHARISSLLMDAGFDDNFWGGIELA